MGRRPRTMIAAAMLIAGLAVGGAYAADDRSPTRHVVQILVIMEAPENFTLAAGRLGFTGVEKIVLESLSMVTYRVSVPKGLTVNGAIEKLRVAFPAIIVEEGELSQ